MSPDLPFLSVVVTVIRHTPLWVWGLLAGIILLGLRQLGPQQVSRVRLILTPLGLSGYSLWGASALFGVSAATLAAWAAGAATMVLLSRPLRLTPAARFRTGETEVEMPGSWLPLILMVTVFAVRYAVIVTLVFHRDWAGDALFGMTISAVLGGLSGVMMGRAWAVLQPALNWPVPFRAANA